MSGIARCRSPSRSIPDGDSASIDMFDIYDAKVEAATQTSAMTVDVETQNDAATPHEETSDRKTFDTTEAETQTVSFPPRESEG